MDGVHDLGGRQGYGPIDVNEAPEPFHEPWEARVLGIVRGFTRPAKFSTDWFRHVRECIDPVDYMSRPYYDQWLQTYAAMLIDAGAVTLEELVTGKSTAPIAGIPPPMPPEKVATAKKAVTRYDRESRAPPAFAIGDAVKTIASSPRGHTRLPQYARGREGRVESLHGSHVLPDTNMAADGPAEPLYTVSFLAADLWPEAAGRTDRVYLDLWESYLERT
jgi:nitrile hydratase beta subunit